MAVRLGWRQRFAHVSFRSDGGPILRRKHRRVLQIVGFSRFLTRIFDSIPISRRQHSWLPALHTPAAPALPPAPVFSYTDGGATGGAIGTQTLATTAGVAAGTSPALTIDKMASGGTLELTATGAGAIVKVTDAAKGTADVLNVVTNANGNVGTVTAADVETINLNIKDALSSITTQGWNDANGNAVKTEDVSATTLAVAGNTATKAITVEGAGNLTLNVAANTKLATVDAGNATGALTLNAGSVTGTYATNQPLFVSVDSLSSNVRGSLAMARTQIGRAHV